MKNLYLFLLCLFNTPLFAQVVFNNYDISPGIDSSGPVYFFSSNGRMYFTAYTPTAYAELWTIDTNGNTQMLTNNATSPIDEYPIVLGEINGKILFAASDMAHGRELWITNGTPSGTKLLKDIYSGNKSGLNNFTFGSVCNGKIYFCAATAANGNELWVTDGTEVGTHLVADINPGTGNANPTHFKTFTGKVVFWADDGTHGYEPWISDGTQAGTTILKDINPTGGGYFYHPSIVSNGLFYFWAQSSHSSSDVKVWVTDGTTTGTQALKSPASRNGSFISKFVEYKNQVYYWNGNDTGIAAQLWVTDGTYTGTRVFSNAAPNTVFHSSRDFLVFKDKLYFTGGLYRQDTMSGCELWVTDGTDAGTKLVVDIAGTFSSTPHWLTALGDYIYFIAADSFSRYKLYRTDGTEAGTQMIAPANATNYNDALYLTSEQGLYLFNNKLWMNAAFTNTGCELWSVENLFRQNIQSTTNRHADITLYPNPAKKMFVLKTNTIFKTCRVTLTDITGRVVLNQHPITNTQSQIPLNSIAPGIYMVDVLLDDKRSVQRLVVE